MWHKTTEHRPNYEKWLREETQCKSKMIFDSSTEPRGSKMTSTTSSFFVAPVTYGRCDTICRLPCSLQPLPEDHRKPRSSISSEEDWERAKIEIAERKQRMRLQEQKTVDAAIKRLERDESEAVRIARTKALDKGRFDKIEYKN